MPDVLPYGRQSLDDDDIAAVVAALKSDFLTSGPRVALFEAALAGVTHSRFAAVLSSGTAALHAAYASLEIGSGDEVIMPPLTFAATANAALYVGARPVFVDIESDTGLIDANAITAGLTRRTRAVVGVDYGGLPADYEAIRTSVAGRDVRVVADAAHSLGADAHGRSVGTLADATIFSFHPVKLVTTGEGGAVVTEDEAVHSRVRDFRTHGITRLEAGPGDEGPWYQEMRVLGFNYRLTDIQCALGESQLTKLGTYVARRRAIASMYDDWLADVSAVQLPGRRPGASSAWHLYVIRVRDVDRRGPMFERLRADGLGVQVHYIPVYRHPYYRELGYRDGLCPNAEAFYAGAISIPIFPAMTDSDVRRVVETIRSAARDLL